MRLPGNGVPKYTKRAYCEKFLDEFATGGQLGEDGCILFDKFLVPFHQLLDECVLREGQRSDLCVQTLRTRLCMEWSLKQTKYPPVLLLTVQDEIQQCAIGFSIFSSFPFCKNGVFDTERKKMLQCLQIFHQMLTQTNKLEIPENHRGTH